MAKRQRHDQIDEQERRQREAVLAQFDAGDTEATLQAMAGVILDYREAVFQLTHAIKLGPGQYFFEASASGGKYSDKVRVARFSEGRLVSLERASKVDDRLTSE